MKRTLALILALSMLLPLAGCSEGVSEETDAAAADSTPDVSAEEVVVEEEEEELQDNLPELDFESIDFRVGAEDGTYYGTSHIAKILVDEMDGEVINDAVFEADRTVEERFNVKLVSVIFDDANSFIKTSAQANDDVCDILTMHDIEAGNRSLEGYFRDVAALPYIDFSMPWWPSYSVDSLTVNGSMYLISSYISYLNLCMTRAVFVNKEEASNYGIEIPYEDVRNGTWYLDSFHSLISDVYQDRDGNGQRDETDFYGYATNSALYAIQESFGIEAVGKDENGELYIAINNDSILTLIEKFYSILYETEGGYYSSGESNAMFANEYSLFGIFCLGDCLSLLRDSEVDYAILPIPKLDEGQENYISGSTDRPFAVPITATNDELLGCMIEALSAEGYRQVRPAFFDIALKQKYASDQDSAEMLEIIGDTIILDFAYIYSNYTGPAWVLMNMMGSANTDFASFYAKNQKVWAKLMEQKNKQFAALKEE